MIPTPEKSNPEFIASWMQDELAQMTRDARYSARRCSGSFKTDGISEYYRRLALDCQDSAALQWRCTRAYIDRECQ